MLDQLRRSRWLGVFVCVLLSGATFAVDLRPHAPDRYVVKRGDTLWDISGRYLEHPWFWPQLWGMNRQDIKNPHLIYPGDVLVLDRTGAEPRLQRLTDGKHDGVGIASDDGADVIRLSPAIREEGLEPAIASISPKVLSKVFKRPLVVDAKAMEDAPRIIAGPDDRVIFTQGDRIYTTKLPAGSSNTWHVYRPNKEIRDPDTREFLGFEIRYAGDVRFEQDFGHVQRLEVIRPVEEIMLGDYLLPMVDGMDFNYVPHLPAEPIEGKIVASYSGVTATAQNDTVVINRGTNHGVDPGQIFGVYKKARAASLAGIGPRQHGVKRFKRPWGKDKKALLLPREQAGHVMIYRVFDRLAYGVVLRSKGPLYVGDEVYLPE